MMAALMRIPPTGSTHQPFFQSVAITAMIMAAVLLRERESKLGRQSIWVRYSRCILQWFERCCPGTQTSMRYQWGYVRTETKVMITSHV